VRELAETIETGAVRDLPLDSAPARWLRADALALDAIGLIPSDDPADLIVFERQGALLVVSGFAAELRRIVAGSIRDLADEPYKTNSVGTHLHLDPTSDPEHRWYSASSASLVIGLSEE